MELTTQLVGLDKVTGDLNAMIARADDLSGPLGRLGLYHQRKAQRILRSGERGIQARNPAGLAASITFAATTHTLEIGTNKVYGASQQFGPRGGFYESSRPGGYLAIPIGFNAAARDNAKYNSPRDVPDGFFFRSKDGGLFFGRATKRKSAEHARFKRGSNRFSSVIVQKFAWENIEVLFVLVKRVIGTDHMYVTHDPEDQVYWDRLVGRWILKGTI